jgi:hypothetical protein
MINRNKTAYVFLFLALTALLNACNDDDGQLNKANVQNTVAMQCLELQSQCQFDVADGHVNVLFDVNKIVAEHAFNISVNYRGVHGIKAVSGYMEGVDMFMGKIPLFLEPHIGLDTIAINKVASSKVQALEHEKPIAEAQRQIFRGELLVGSCSAEQMTWKIWLTFTMADNQSHTIMLTIVSYRQ